MSDDYNVVCHACKQYMHFGQRMANSYSLGHGGDDKKDEIRHEKQECIDFCMKHAWCNPALGVQIIVADPWMDGLHHAGYRRAE